jgi:UDP-sulfoquinovose synthase
MKVFIAGIDGYLGWELALWLTERGHTVGGCDNFFRRQWVEEMGSWSAVPIASIEHRLDAFRATFGRPLTFHTVDLRDATALRRILAEFEPDAIVHLGECPSAPYSMIDAEHAVFVQTNNIVASLNLVFAMRDVCPDAHLVKLGTMGEYGTPNVAIPEGFFEVTYRGRTDTLPFPRQAGSWYHWSKVHDSNNLMFACRQWNLRATDVMQGVVFGTNAHRRPAGLVSRLDFDQAFGTAIHRFCCQAVIGHPLTVYGGGQQTRALLPLRDSMTCLTLAIEHPAEPGEYRVFNQFERISSLADVAMLVRHVAGRIGLDPVVEHFENPRSEREGHFYSPDRRKLDALGYRPESDVEGEIDGIFQALLPNRARIEAKQHLLIPDVRWDGRHRRSELLS